MPLREIGSESAIPPLIEALQSLDERTRVNAIVALGEIGTEEAIIPIVTLVPKDTNFSDVAWESVSSTLVNTLEDSENPIVRRLLVRILQLFQATSVTDAFVMRLYDPAESIINRYMIINGLTHQHHLQNLAQSTNLLETLSSIALRDGDDQFVRYGALVLLSSADTSESLNFLDINQAEFLELIEANYEANIPFYFPDPLSSGQTDPSVEVVVAANINPIPRSGPLPVPQILIPPMGTPHGAKPDETLQTLNARLGGKPAICGFSWVAQNWSRCRD